VKKKKEKIKLMTKALVITVKSRSLNFSTLFVKITVSDFKKRNPLPIFETQKPKNPKKLVSNFGPTKTFGWDCLFMNYNSIIG